jgi:hypothetical protein
MDPILPGITPLEECVVRIAQKDQYEKDAYQEINNITQRIMDNYGYNPEIAGLVEKLQKEVVLLTTIATEVTSSVLDLSNENPPVQEELRQKLLDEQNNICTLITQLKNNILKKS